MVFVVFFMVFVMIGGKFGFGYFVDWIDYCYLMWVMIVLFLFVILLFRNVDGIIFYIVVVIVYGIGVGGMLFLFGVMVVWCFGVSVFGSVMGLFGLFLMLSVVGLVIMGWFCDVFGLYELVFSILLIGFVLFVVMVYFLC